MAFGKRVPIQREVIGGMNVSFIGQFDHNSEAISTLRRTIEGLGEMYPTVAQNIDKVRIVNRPGFDASTKSGVGVAYAETAGRTNITLNADAIMNMEATGSRHIARTGSDLAISDVFNHEFGHHADVATRLGGDAANPTILNQMHDVLGTPTKKGRLSKAYSPLERVEASGTSVIGKKNINEFFAEEFSRGHANKSGFEASAAFRQTIRETAQPRAVRAGLDAGAKTAFHELPKEIKSVEEAARMVVRPGTKAFRGGLMHALMTARSVIGKHGI